MNFLYGRNTLFGVVVRVTSSGAAIMRINAELRCAVLYVYYDCGCYYFGGCNCNNGGDGVGGAPICNILYYIGYAGVGLGGDFEIGYYISPY